MPYIGSSASPLPVNFAAVQAQSFNGTGSQTAFTLSRTVPSAASIEVLVNNVQQSPYDASYSVSGTTLTFSEAPSSGTNNVYVVYRDQSLGSLVDESAYRRAEVDSAVAAKVSKAGDTMTGALALPAGGLNVGSGQLIVDSNGRVTMPFQPAFATFLSSSATRSGSDLTLIFDDIRLNVGGHYTSNNGRFTAPITGLYQFTFSSNITSGTDFINAQTMRNGATWLHHYQAIASSSWKYVSLTDQIYLNAGDYVQIRVTSSGSFTLDATTLGASGQWTHFAGCLVG